MSSQTRMIEALISGMSQDDIWELIDSPELENGEILGYYFFEHPKTGEIEIEVSNLPELIQRLVVWIYNYWVDLNVEDVDWEQIKEALTSKFEYKRLASLYYDRLDADNQYMPASAWYIGKKRRIRMACVFELNL